MAGDNPTGSCYLWFITSFLLISILSGGTLLVLYLIHPDSPNTSKFPIIGIVLICLPWFFWFITCFYRILSRKLGFRMVCFGGDVQPVGRATDVEGGNAGKTNTSTGNVANSRQEGSRDSSESETPLKMSMAS